MRQRVLSLAMGPGSRDRRVRDGRCGDGGSLANLIPGAKADGSGSVGNADVILWTNDRVYIWEVKPNASVKPDPKNKAAVAASNYAFKKGVEQLDRYVEKLQDVLDDAGDERVVRKGPTIGSATFVYGAKGRGRVWSRDDYRGMRYYGTDRDDDKEKATPSPSPGPGTTAAPRSTAEPTATPTPSATGFYSTAPPGERSWMGSEVGMVASGFTGIVFVLGAPYEAAVGGGAVVLYELAA